MPQLEDTRKLVAKTTPSGSDLLAVFDVTEVGNNTIKKATLAQIFQAAVTSLPGPFADDTAAAAGGVALGGAYKNNSAGFGVISYRAI
jgi:hypothetical protein